MAAQRSARPAPRSGWMMVAIAPVFLGIGSGALVSISVFLKPLVAEFGWNRGEASTAYLAATLASGVSGIAMGWLADRFSTRPVVWLGAAGLGLACLLLSRQTALWQFVLFSAMLGGLGNAAFLAPLTANVAGWFDDRKGLALGLTMAGHALGQGLVVLLARVLIVEVGWRSAYLAIALLAWIVLLPLATLVRNAPGDRPGAAAPARLPAVAPDPRVLVPWLGIAAVFCCVCMASPTVHAVALASDRGVAPTAAAGVLAAIMAAGCLGRIAFGRLADRLGGVESYLLASAAQTVIVPWFPRLEGALAFFLLAVPFGLASSGVMVSVLCAVREMVPARRRALAVAVVTLCGSVGMGLGGLQGGALFDATGSYTLPFALSAAAGGVNLVILGALLWFLRRPPLAAPALPASALPASLGGRRLGLAS